MTSRRRTTAQTPTRVLLVGRAMERMAAVLYAMAPAADLVIVASAAAGEAHLGQVDAAVVADRLRPAYLTAPRLRWLHIVGAGVDGFSIPGLRDVPFPVTHKVEASIIPMAEHVMAQVLVVARRVLEYRQCQAEGRWAGAGRGGPTDHLIELHGATLGLLGLGRAGLAVARRARAFGMRVIGVKRRPVERLPNVQTIYPASQLTTMLAQADFVAILAPLTDETHGLIGEAELRAMQPTAYLINISRGPIVQEAVLVRALREGWIAGASLDVFEHEPLDSASPLWTLPNAIITPHCGGVGPNLARETAREIGENLRRFLTGRPLRHLLDRADVVTTFAPPSH